MQTLPTTNLRANVFTGAVSTCRLPRVGVFMRSFLQPEPYDPTFQGQELETSYFDTRNFDLRKVRLKKDHYCTIRIRCYPGPVYALSAKTESGKFRVEIPTTDAEFFLSTPYNVQFEQYLPPDLLARLLDLTDNQGVTSVCTTCMTRYAVEDGATRLTLDSDIHTNTGKCFPCHVLEAKMTSADLSPPLEVLNLGLPPLKLSKYLWATATGHA